MKKTILLMHLLFIAGLLKISAVEFPADKFMEGTELYTVGKYQESLDVWLSIYKAGFSSPNLNYNIGNAYFKLNDIPHSILFYERALLLNPANEDIRYNLQVARTYVVDKFNVIPEIFFVTWYNFISLLLSSDTWARLSIGTFILFLSLLSFYLFTAVYRFKITSFWLAMLMLIISIASFSFSLRNKSIVFQGDKAIIMCPQVNGKSSPDNSGTDLFLIHEGTKVSVTDALGDWNEVKLPDGNKGWIPADCLEKI
ncbi:MAG: tetratricopeptide repeat protein [Bacteroidales bacterium]